MSLRSFAFAVLCCIFAFPTNAQQTSTGVTQNPTAVTLLTQSLNAMGGLAAITAVQDYTGTGTITYNWANQPVSAPATVQSMSVSTFRIDSSLSNGIQTWAIDGMAGVFITPSGSRRNAPFYTLATAGTGERHAYLDPETFTADTPLGRYQGVSEQVVMSATPGGYDPVLVPRGSCAPAWLPTPGTALFSDGATVSRERVRG